MLNILATSPTAASIVVPLVLVFVLIIINGVFAASEIALVSVNKNRVELDAENGNKRAMKLMKFLGNQTGFLSTIQIGITLIGLINGMFVGNTFAAMISNAIWGPTLTGSQEALSILIMVGISFILAYFQVVLGELVPKKIGMRNPEKISYIFIGFIRGLSIVMSPFVWILTVSANLVGRAFGLKPTDEDTGVSEDEIRLIVAASGKKGAINQAESEMIHNIFEFDDTTVDEVMTHRTEVIGIEINMSREEIIEFAVLERYTRYPVYEGSIDNIVGTIHIKDLIRYLLNEHVQEFSVRDVLRAPYYVPDSKKIDELLKEMKSSKNHIAVVIDEYGGTAGIITIEDLIEEIIGDIEDEYDDEDVEVEIYEDGTYVFDGLIDLDEVQSLLKIPLLIDEYDTLGGFVLSLIGRFPEKDESITVEYNGYSFRILAMDDKVIEKIHVEKLPEEKNEKEVE